MYLSNLYHVLEHVLCISNDNLVIYLIMSLAINMKDFKVVQHFATRLGYSCVHNIFDKVTICSLPTQRLGNANNVFIDVSTVI